MPPIDFTYRFRPENPRPLFVPRDWEDAVLFLQAGNALIGRFYHACRHGGYDEGSLPPVIELSASDAHGEPVGDDGLPIQMPFAAMLGCSDARVPTELLFGQEFNDIFNIRVAGNILAEEGIGSLLYALRTFAPDSVDPRGRSLKLAGVLGHRGCGAVKATIKTFQSGPTAARVFDDPIGSLVSKIAAPPLALAANLLDSALGDGASSSPANFATLTELVVYLNAAWSAHEVRKWVDDEGPDMSHRVGVVFGVFDPKGWAVHSLPECPSDRSPDTFRTPPRDRLDLREYGEKVLSRLLEPAS